jgi:small-conductance mechanosensitive channel
MTILKKVAGAHASILQTPAPQSLFVGYGDSSINFQVRAWTDKFDDWPQIRSDLVMSIYQAALKAGMSFPFPQRDVRLIEGGGSKPVITPATGVSQTPPQEKPAKEEGGREQDS